MTRSLDAAAREIAAAVARDGVAVHPGPLSRRRFFDIASRVGRVFHELAIYIDPANTHYVRSPEPVPFHTDHVRANVVAWLCEVPERCAQCYLDAARVYAELSPAQRRAMDQVRAYCPYPRGSLCDPDRPAVPTRVVAHGRQRDRFFWVPKLRPAAVRGAGPAPWIKVPEQARLQRALAAFFERIAVPAEQADVSVSLGRGEAVFVDNNRFLHGRGPLPARSPRMLYRLWINTDGWASARDHHLTRPSPARALRRA